MGLLDGVTVLDLASVGPAARASRWLADYGADVVKVAPVPAHAAVQTTPPAHAYSGGRGTRRVQLDLKSGGGREAFLRGAEHSDVMLESFRPGVASRLGIGYDEVKSRNPRIVYCSTSGYGQSGPRSGWAGHDLDYLAVGGFLASTERGEGGKPPVPGATVADAAAGGMHAVMAILAALVGRTATGEGCFLDVCVADGVLALMALQVDEHLATGSEPGPGTTLLTGRYACYDTYPAADGWLAVAAIEKRFWASLCTALGLERWTDAQYDDSVQHEIRNDLTAVLRTRPRDAWVAELAGADTCVAPVLSVAEAAATAPLTTATAPDGSSYRQLPPLLAGAVREPSYDLPDQSVTDTDDVLAAWGLSRDDIARLRDEGAAA